MFFYVSGMLLIYYFGVNGAFTFLQIKEKYLMYSIYGLEYARNRMVIVAQTIIPYKECYRKHVKLIESMIRLFCSIHFVMSNVGKPIMSLDIWKSFFLKIKVYTWTICITSNEMLNFDLIDIAFHYGIQLLFLSKISYY